MAIRSMLYMSEEVKNKARKFGSLREYYPVFVERENGDVLPALFTKSQIHKAIQRAHKNPEDVGERVTWLERIFGTKVF